MRTSQVAFKPSRLVHAMVKSSSVWDKKSWKEMTTPPAVLLSDNKVFTENIAVQPARDLPAYMTSYVAPPAGVQIYGAMQQQQEPVVAMQQQPPMQAQVPGGQMDRGW